MDVLTALTASFGLMSGYYAARWAWRKLRYTSPSQRGIDPVGEAEVYLAYGKTRQAVRVLKDSLRDDPDNLSAKVVLLRAYSTEKNREAYISLARDVQAQVQGQPVWRTIQENGRQLDPLDPLFEAKI